ncbi:MAG: FAD-dependent oxidoreductase [Acidobacteriota bacterium]
MASILILGGGFAAIAAAEKLSANLGDGHEITIVSIDDHFTFYPALVPLVFGDFEPDEIHFDLRPKLAERGIRFIKGEVLSIDAEGRTVTLTGEDVEGTIHFDYLIVALGRRLATERVPGFFEHAHHLLGVSPALKFKSAVTSFQKGAIVVGLCPDAFLPVPVCETALALAERFKTEIADGKVSVTAVFPTTLEKAFAGSALFRDIDEEFDSRGIRLVSDFAVERVTETSVRSALGATLHYDLLMLVPPFRGQASLRHLAPVTDAAGFAQVNDGLQVKGYDNIYAAGDIISLPGPRFGYMAIRQGKVAASNIIAQLKGEEPDTEYTHTIEWALDEKYTDPVFFHYGFWDETVEDYDENAFFGMAKVIRQHYGPVRYDAAKPGNFAPKTAAK